jgi:hypothetical protein
MGGKPMSAEDHRIRVSVPKIPTTGSVCPKKSALIDELIKKYDSDEKPKKPRKEPKAKEGYLKNGP